jgi:2-hydroxychromene-2-carboxylate isomerase
MRASWYFDLISPFSYLHLKQFGRLPAELEIEYVPVLFAGMLKHWESKGPAEVPPKRLYMYRQLTWYAGHIGIPFRMPPAHPFNSLHALRLLIAAGPERKNVETAFDMVWKEGRDLQDPGVLAELAQRLGIRDPQAAAADEPVKARLKANTDAAIARGVFGVWKTPYSGVRIHWR